MSTNYNKLHNKEVAVILIIVDYCYYFKFMFQVQEAEVVYALHILYYRL